MGKKEKSRLAQKGSLNVLSYCKLLEEELKLPFKPAVQCDVSKLSRDYVMNQRVSKLKLVVSRQVKKKGFLDLITLLTHVHNYSLKKKLPYNLHLEYDDEM